MMRLTAIRRGPRVGWAVLVLAGCVALSACARNEPSTPPDGGIAISDIIANADDHVGQQVMVSGVVNDIRSPGVFTIGATDGPGELLVISSNPAASASPIEEGMPVRVEGVVRVFSRTGYATWPTVTTYDPIGPYLADPYFNAWEERASIVANAIRPLR